MIQSDVTAAYGNVSKEIIYTCLSLVTITTARYHYKNFIISKLAYSWIIITKLSKECSVHENCQHSSWNKENTSDLQVFIVGKVFLWTPCRRRRQSCVRRRVIWRKLRGRRHCTFCKKWWRAIYNWKIKILLASTSGAFKEFKRLCTAFIFCKGIFYITYMWN